MLGGKNGLLTARPATFVYVRAVKAKHTPETIERRFGIPGILDTERCAHGFVNKKSSCSSSNSEKVNRYTYRRDRDVLQVDLLHTRACTGFYYYGGP